VPKIVKVQARSADRGDRIRPLHELVEVAAPDRAPALAGEHERIRGVADAAVYVLFQHWQGRLGQGGP
jgi:hypothetical protein